MLVYFYRTSLHAADAILSSVMLVVVPKRQEASDEMFLQHYKNDLFISQPSMHYLLC
jgi:hypothetical protein